MITTLVWRAGIAHLTLAAPPGQHVAPNAPGSIAAGDVHIDLRGDPSTFRFPVAPGPLAVTATFALCEDEGGACHPLTVSGEGNVIGRRGSFPLAAVLAKAPAAPAGAAVKLLDFTAVWCPPCNLLGAEVLHGPLPYPVEAVDVDLPASWPLKDRYAVGGYPTLLAVDAEGAEVARLVGYPGREPTLAWIADLATVTPLHALETADLSGETAAAAARRLAEAQKETAARRLLASASDGVDFRVARLLLDQKPEDATWLFDRAPPGPWLLDALSADPALWIRVAPLLPALSPVDAADVLAVAAEGMPAAEALLARASAIALVRATLTGDPAHDRGQVVGLADLYVDIGDPAGALALLDRYAALYPEEFTFHHAAARQLLAASRWPEAEARARVALAKAYGDQRLRAVMTLAKALVGLGRKADALAEIDAVLAATERPAADVEVRTHRYLGEVEKLRKEIAGG